MTTETYYHVPTTKVEVEEISRNVFMLHLKDAELMFNSNFSGAVTPVNRNGTPNCIVTVSYEDAQVLEQEFGFKVYDYNPRKRFEEELDPQQYPNKLGITLKLSMDSDLIRSGSIPMPEVVSYIEGRREESFVVYGPDTVGILDNSEIENLIIVVRCSRANPERGQKWTQPYISKLGAVLKDRITFFEDTFGFQR